MYPHPDHILSSDVRFTGGYDENRYRADLERVEQQTEKMWEMARELGYKVPLFEGNEVVEYPAEQATLTKRYFARARRFISEHQEGPFFLLITPSMPHIPLAASEPFRGKSQRGLYGDVIEEIDWEVGQLREHLQQLGLDSRTLLLFTSDNGPWLEKGEDGGSAGELHGGKASNFEGGVRVPAIAAWPGAIPAGSVSSEVAGTLDLFPTFAGLAGVDLPADHYLDGISLVTHLFEPRNRLNRSAWFYNLEGEIAGVRQGNWKYLRPGKVASWGEFVTDETQLFNLSEDPGEQNNLAGSKPGKVQELEALVKEFEKALK
jgi:arylsulfatase A-like enzyme